MGMTTWRAEVERRMALTGERLDQLVAVEPVEALDDAFDNGRYRSSPRMFRAWTNRFVYYPVWIEGYPRVGSALRSPQIPGDID